MLLAGVCATSELSLINCTTVLSDNQSDHSQKSTIITFFAAIIQILSVAKKNTVTTVKNSSNIMHIVGGLRYTCDRVLSVSGILQKIDKAVSAVL